MYKKHQPAFFIVLIFLFTFFLGGNISCSQQYHSSFNQIELICDLRTLDVFSETIDDYLIDDYWPIFSPKQQEKDIDIVFLHDCGVFQSFYFALNEENQVSKHYPLFSNIEAKDTSLTSLQIILQPYSITIDSKQNINYIGYVGKKGEGLFQLNPHSGKIDHYHPLQRLDRDSIFASDDQKVYFTQNGQDLYRAEQLDTDQPTIKKVKSFGGLNYALLHKFFEDKEFVRIRNILHIEENTMFLSLLFKDSKDSFFAVVISLDLASIKHDLVFFHPEALLSQWFFMQISDEFILLYNYGTNQKEEISNKRVKFFDKTGKLLHEYNLSQQISGFSLNLMFKTHPEGTYLYWLDDYVLYRWKTPLE